MHFPDDLTPSEQAQLRRTLAELAHLPVAGDDEAEEDFAPDLGEDQPGAAPLPPVPPPPPGDHLSLTTGRGHWKGHDFTLAPEELRAALSAVQARVAHDLTAEIARLAAEAGLPEVR